MLSLYPDRIWRLVLVAFVTLGIFTRDYQSGARPVQAGQSQVAPVTPASGKASFDLEILPIFKSNCVRCHGSEAKMKELNLSSYETIMKGSESGPVIVPGKIDESRLYKMVKDGVMPAGGAGRLSAAQVSAIRSWIEGGAASGAQSVETATAVKVTYQDVLPVLLLRCTVCHGLRRQEGGLDLHSYAAILRGGNSGSVVVPGKPAESLILTKIRSGEMPPKKRMSALATSISACPSRAD
jgi:mono/diheme cytochrome c family protein